MKVKVLSVQPTIAPNSHEVLLSVGADRYKFIFTTEVNRVGENLLQTTHGDSLRDSFASRAFSEMFRFNQRVAMQVTNVEKLPAAMLDEAVNFLESLYVKADRVE